MLAGRENSNISKFKMLMEMWHSGREAAQAVHAAIRTPNSIDNLCVILILESIMGSPKLNIQDGADETATSTQIIVLGEVLWDLLPNHTSLGGAPLNFAVHAGRLGYEPLLISAVGTDPLGRQAACVVQELGLSTNMLQNTDRWPTGTASVELDRQGQPTFTIRRPAAYDAVRLSDADVRRLTAVRPSWFYYGTLFPSTAEGKDTLLRLLDALPAATRFYDVNLRPGFDSPDLVAELLARAAVVKMNDSEMSAIAKSGGLPSGLEEFCKAAVHRYGWRAVCVTLGERGCAVLADHEYIMAEGCPVDVADSVGAGDAFAAGFMHGLTQGWPVDRVAAFANRVGSLVASRSGATPYWSISEMAEI